MTLALCAGHPFAARAQELTLERIYGNGDLSAESFDGRWMADGNGWAMVERTEDGATELWRVEAASGARTPLVRAAELVPPGGGEPIEIEEFAFSPDGRMLLLFTDAQQVWRARTKGTYYTFDLEGRTLRPLSEREGWQMFAKFSPDGGRVAFVRDHDLWMTDLATGRERRLTSDGSETIINGTTDWVYEEELGLRDAFRWSPDGTRIAYWRFDQSPVREFYLLDQTSLYPEPIPIRYPKVGTANSLVRVGSFDLASGETTWFDLPCHRAPAAGGEECYIARMEWLGADQVVIQRLNRHQNRLELLAGHAATGAVETILVEEDAAWVDVNDDLTWIDEGRRFIWTSERDGWNHLYLYERDGTLVRQLTQGEWEVSEVAGVDDERDRVYFTAARNGPLGRSVLSVDLRGRVAPVFEGERGWHDVELAPGFRYAVLTRSTVEEPPVSVLARLRGAETATVRVLVDNAALRARLDS
ncbi:MAG: DPP IV N-terminal domain-containing protein, partial [Gemmatimonadota bacterium]